MVPPGGEEGAPPGVRAHGPAPFDGRPPQKVGGRPRVPRGVVRRVAAAPLAAGEPLDPLRANPRVATQVLRRNGKAAEAPWRMFLGGRAVHRPAVAGP